MKGLIQGSLLLLVLILILATGGSMVAWQKYSQSITQTNPSPESNPPTDESPSPAPEATSSSSTPSTDTSTVSVFEGDLRNLPTASPAVRIPFEGESSEIQVISSKTSYNKGESVEIIFKNNSGKAFSYSWGPGCGLKFERKVGTNWQTQEICSNCGSLAPCVIKTFEAGQTFVEKTPTDSQTIPGIYRAIFGYVGITSYSNEFNIF